MSMKTGITLPATGATFLFAVLALAGAGVSADGPNGFDALIDRYLEAVRTEDWKTMASLLAPDAHYLDTSMTIFDRPPIDLRGPEAIVGFFRNANEESGTEEVRYDIRRRWTSGDTTVIDIVVHVRAAGDFFDVAKKTVEIEAALITILRIVDGKVIYHADYTDYAEGLRQIDEQRETP